MNRKQETGNRKQGTIVSLTSFPEAIPYCVRAIRSVLDGSMLPDRIVLYLDTWKFPGGALPEELEKLKSECPLFEARFDSSDIRSYKKLIPALRDFPEDVIVTVDDDIFYHRHMLRDLVRMHRRMPDAVIAHRVRRIIPDRPYSMWRKYKWYDFIFRRLRPGYANLQTGVGGVLYPPHSLDETMLDPELFMSLAPTVDDVWFWAAAVSKGTYVVPLPNGQHRCREIGKPKELSLKTTNLKPGDDRNYAAFRKILGSFPAIKRRLGYEKQELSL